MIYSTGKNQVGIKNGSNLYRVPTPSHMRFAADDPTHAELYLTFHSGPHSLEPGDTGMIYRVKLSDQKSENVVTMFTNPSSQGSKLPLPKIQK